MHSEVLGCYVYREHRARCTPAPHLALCVSSTGLFPSLILYNKWRTFLSSLNCSSKLLNQRRSLGQSLIYSWSESRGPRTRKDPPSHPSNLEPVTELPSSLLPGASWHSPAMPQEVSSCLGDGSGGTTVFVCVRKIQKRMVLL